MKEFIEKQTDVVEEKIKVTSLEIIVTGTKDKPYFQIKYKEVGKEYYNIGYGSYELNYVFGWKEKCFEIVNQLAEEYNQENDDTDYANIELYAFWQKHQWIPCSERLPEKDMWCLATFESGNVDKIQYLESQKWWNGEMADNRVIAWKKIAPYQPKGE